VGYKFALAAAKKKIIAGQLLH